MTSVLVSDKKTDNFRKTGLPVFHFFLTFYDKSRQKTSIQAFLDLYKTDGDTLNIETVGISSYKADVKLESIFARAGVSANVIRTDSSMITSDVAIT